MTKLDKLHKEIDKDKAKELEAKIRQVSQDFIKFQIDNEVRATIRNQFQGDANYPPNAILDLIMTYAVLAWRPMEPGEKEELQKKLAESHGIEIPNKEIKTK